MWKIIKKVYNDKLKMFKTKFKPKGKFKLFMIFFNQR